LKLPNPEYERGLEKRKRLLAWTYVALMMTAILISLPLTPTLWKMGSDIIGGGINNSGYIISLFILALIGLYMLLNYRKYGPIGMMSLALLGLIYFYMLKHHCKFPAERLHLIEYGLLSFLAFHAFQFSFTRATSYGFGFIFSSVFGFVDELIQYVLPNRSFEVRDIVTNVFGSALGLILLGVLLRPYVKGAAVESRKC